MSNLEEYAKKELELAFSDEKDGMQDLINDNILELIRTFSKQGHSGMTAPYVLRYFNRLVNWKPILPLTGKDSEWNEIEPGWEQNNRCFSVFRKDHDNSTAYDVEGIIFEDESGTRYTSSESRIPVAFPYIVPDKPKIVKKPMKLDSQESQG